MAPSEVIGHTLDPIVPSARLGARTTSRCTRASYLSMCASLVVVFRLDQMLALDCFGFGLSSPSIAEHGFTTKL
jgi:hypothetical protein